MVVCKFFQQGYCRFGQSCRFEHIYGSKYSYRAPQSQGEIYSQERSSNNRLGSANSEASSLFRSAAQSASSVFNNATNTTSFGQNTKPQSVFDRLGPPQNHSVGFQSTQAKSIFAQASQSVFGQPQSPPNVFQNQQQELAKSVFAQASQRLFSPQNESFSKQPNEAANVFASAAKNLQHNPFTQQVPVNNTAGNIFQISEGPTSNVFGVVSNAVEQTANSEEDGIYSKMEDLSSSDIEAFESSAFQLGFIPELPPPKALCIDYR